MHISRDMHITRESTAHMGGAFTGVFHPLIQVVM